MSTRILVVEDDEATLEAVSDALEDFGCSVERCADATSARAALEQRDFDAVVTDLRMPDVDGLELCDRIVGSRPDLPVILMTAYGDTRVVSSAMRAGVVDFLQKPFTVELLGAAIQRALSHRNGAARVARLPVAAKEDDSPLPEMIGDSPAMKGLSRRVRQAAAAGCSVLVTGETGTGKELVARAIHRLGDRAGGPFVALNCAALPAEMIESELFGHAHGAFTGAVRSRHGLFMTADHGTLFLDEVGAMPLPLQSRLLRAMEARAIRAVGTVDEVAVDVRVVAATNADLRDSVANGTFREDLLLRLSAFPVEIPPLRARGDDVILITRHFLSKFDSAPRSTPRELTAAAIRALRRYPWPGNVRELENCVQAALVAAREGPIDVEHLPARVRDGDASAEVRGDVGATDLDVVERRHIERVLEEAGGNRSAAARKLGMNRVTLYRKLKRYRLG